MSSIRVFVNSGMVDLPAGASVEQAVREFDPALSQRLASGEAYATDGRGIELDPADTLTGGAIVRVVVRARRGTNADA
jgi:hypothetical protein